MGARKCLVQYYVVWQKLQISLSPTGLLLKYMA